MIPSNLCWSHHFVPAIPTRTPIPNTKIYLIVFIYLCLANDLGQTEPARAIVWAELLCYRISVSLPNRSTPICPFSLDTHRSNRPWVPKLRPEKYVFVLAETYSPVLRIRNVAEFSAIVTSSAPMNSFVGLLVDKIISPKDISLNTYVTGFSGTGHCGFCGC